MVRDHLEKVATSADRTLPRIVAALCILGIAVHLAVFTKSFWPFGTRTGKAQRLGMFVGAVAGALGMMRTWQFEHDQGWWHSRIPGHPDPALPLLFIELLDGHGIAGGVLVALVYVRAPAWL